MFAGRHGTCRWTLSPFRYEAGCKLIKDTGELVSYDPGASGSFEKELGKRTTVDFILCQGSPPTQVEALLDKGSLVIWFQHRGKRKVTEIGDPMETRIGHAVISMNHAFLGGVTTFGTRVHFLSRVLTGDWAKKLRDEMRAGVPAVLGSCISPVHGVSRFVDPPTDPVHFADTAKGLLSWDRRFGRVLVPTVYNKKKWGYRRLVVEELCAVVDMPLDRTKSMTTSTMTIASGSPLPGKIYAEAFRLAACLLDSVNEGPFANKAGFYQSVEAPREDEQEERPRKKARVELELPTTMQLAGQESWSSVGSLSTQDADDTDSVETFIHTNVSVKGTTVSGKAAKSDDAAVPEHLWNERVRPWVNQSVKETSFQKALALMRKTMLARWVRNVESSWLEWLARKRSRGIKIDPRWLSAGERALRYARKASWWGWDGGSALFFWRWPWQEYYLEDYVLGPPVRFISDPPSDMRPQPPYSDEEVRLKVRKKVQSVLEKGYIELADASTVKSCMYMFDVPKGDTDIRMVYDGSRSGLNGALESLWFTLPTLDSVTRSMCENTWCADNDYGEMFLNFPLHPELQQYCGVDLAQLYQEEAAANGGRLMGRWSRLAMGLRPSPQGATMGALRAKPFLMGDPKDERNPFHWAKVVLNLPGTKGYNPTLPWIAKYRSDGRLAADAQDYIDDIPFNAPSEDLAWRASSQWAKRCAWLGLQDAARKRREPSKQPGAWAGSVVGSDKSGLYKTVLQERWIKTQKGVRWFGHYLGLSDERDKVLKEKEGTWFSPEPGCPGGHIPFKEAERIRGFLIYVSRTFVSMVPYLKGIHLTLDSWRPFRDEDGWRLAEAARPRDLGLDHVFPEHAPRYVRAVHRLKQDIRALMDLTKYEEAPRPRIRPKRLAVMYMVGDASGAGFGISRWSEEDNQVHVDHGTWTEEGSKQSSNYREAANLVLRLEILVKEGKIEKGTELFVFTDNLVTENAFFKGASKSKTLHDLVLRLRALEMRGDLHLHCVWIPGTRMIAQGTDGLSRGDYTSGVMAGKNFLSFLPIHQSALERQPTLQKTLIEMAPVELVFLTEQDWFETLKVEPLATYVWCPPPCVSDVALECLCRSKQAHPAPLGYGNEQIRRENLARRCQSCGGEIRKFSGITCVNFGQQRLGRVCQGAWHARCYRQADNDPFPNQCFVEEDDLMEHRELEDEDPGRFKEARDGDDMMILFQCDLCHFECCAERLPVNDDERDKLTLTCIRRANLDAFWGRERSTVAGNRQQAMIMERLTKQLSWDSPFVGPEKGLPMRDLLGVKVACAMLLRSLDAGNNAKTIQYETMRRLRSFASNYVHAQPGGVGAAFMQEDAGSLRLSNSPTNSLWFHRFMRGCHKRMGDVWIPDRPVTLSELKAALSILENDWVTAVADEMGKHKTALTAMVFIGGFFAALRGKEIVRIDLGGLIQHWDEAILFEDAPHVPLMLSGRFKREVGEKVFCQPLAPVSKSGIKILEWTHRVISTCVAAGWKTGPLFRVESKRKGTPWKRAAMGDLDDDFHRVLVRVQEKYPGIIPAGVNVEEEYSVYRSLRRGATSAAQNARIPAEVIEANNRWRKHARARGLTPGMSMLERYTDAKASVPTLIRFSGSL